MKLLKITGKIYTVNPAKIRSQQTNVVDFSTLSFCFLHDKHNCDFKIKKKLLVRFLSIFNVNICEF